MVVISAKLSLMDGHENIHETENLILIELNTNSVSNARIKMEALELFFEMEIFNVVDDFHVRSIINCREGFNE